MATSYKLTYPQAQSAFFEALLCSVLGRLSMTRFVSTLAIVAFLGIAPAANSQILSGADDPARQKAIADFLLAGRFQWTLTGPLVGPAERPEDACQSIKDPTIVFFNGRWHLFCTIRSQKPRIRLSISPSPTGRTRTRPSVTSSS